MEAQCLQCQKKTAIEAPQVDKVQLIKRVRISGSCAECHRKSSTFISRQKWEALPEAQRAALGASDSILSRSA